MTEIEDFEFLSNVKALADNGTLKRVLEMIQEDEIARWKSTKPADLQIREHSYRMISAVKELKDKITSLISDEKVRQFNARRIVRNP